MDFSDSEGVGVVAVGAIARCRVMVQKAKLRTYALTLLTRVVVMVV